MTTPIEPVRWMLESLPLGEAAFVADLSTPNVDSCTICFWFTALHHQGIQVIASVGNQNADEIGWSIFLAERTLHYRALLESGSPAEMSIPLEDDERWHHVACVIDPQHGRLHGYLDGRSIGSTALTGWLRTAAPLILGGYTDPAGGHWDHTFGRQGSGRIDDFRLYPHTLSAEQIAALVPPPQEPLTARFRADLGAAHAPVEVHFDAGESADSAESIRACFWDYGDGQRGLGLQTQHTYRYAGDYTVRLTVLSSSYVQSSVEQGITLSGAENPLRFTPVFVNGTEGYACYRIPSVVRALNGDLIAFAEGRVHHCSDSTKAIRIVCKRSTDNGQTWGPVQIVAQNLIDDEEYTCMNCCPVVDTVRGTGRIVVVFRKGEHSEWDVAKGIGMNRAFCVMSDDNGQTWHGERDITPFVHRPNEWRIMIPAQGHAIQLRGAANPAVRGRLFYAGSFTCGDVSVFESQNYAFWSDDLGETWQIGGILPRIGLNEAIAVERADGSVIFNTRSYTDRQPDGFRAVTVGHFDAQGAITFEDTYLDRALICPAVQASTVRYTWPDEAQFGGRSRILFSNPAHPRARLNLTVRLSYDEGRTWPISKVIDPGPAAYSDLVIQRDGRIGVLYERGNQGGLWYVSFPLDWLTDGAY